MPKHRPLQPGLTPKATFAAISSNPEIQDRLEKAYGSVDLIDPWVGGLAEDAHADAMVGELFFTVLKKQFESLRDGDPFWYERDLDGASRLMVEAMTLSRVIRLNTTVGNELPANVFRAPANAPF